MPNARREFSPEFKREAVALLESSGRPLMQVAMVHRIRGQTFGGSATLALFGPQDSARTGSLATRVYRVRLQASQVWAINGAPPLYLRRGQKDWNAWCRLQESNPRPSVYKTAALPSELNRRPNPALRQRTPKVQPSVRAICAVRPGGANDEGSWASARIPAAVTSASLW